VLGVLNNTALWLAGLILSGLGINRLDQVSLLDNAPLAELLDEILPCEKIQHNIDAGLLHAVSITLLVTSQGVGYFLSGEERYQALEGRAPSGVCLLISK